VLERLEATPLSAWMRQALWAYPSAEALHLIGLAVMVGAAAMFDLRLLGLSRTVSVRALARHLLPWSRLGFGVVVLTGALMFSATPTDFAANPAFQAKLALIGLAGLNIAVFHSRTARSFARWDSGVTPPPSAKLAGGLSLALWSAVIVLGRFVAYV
jgi:hypothetical protein